MSRVQTRKGKRGTSYRVQFMRDNQRVSKSFDKKADAERFLAQVTLDDDLAFGLANHTLNNLTLSTAISEYLSQHTGKDVHIIQRLAWWSEQHGTKPVGKINRPHVKQSLQQLISAGRATSTRNRYKAALSSVYRYLNDEYDITHNPARQVQQLKEPRAPDRFLSEEELHRLLLAAQSCYWDRMRMLILMAVSTGARRSELLGLRWGDIDFKQHTAYLDDTKNGERRILPLTGDVMQELEQFREIGTGHLFPHPSKLNASFRNFDKHWQSTKKAANITNLRFHDLRHTTGSWLAQAGVSIKAVQEILGHKTITTTQRYVHHDVKHKAEALQSVFGGINNGQ